MQKLHMYQLEKHESIRKKNQCELIKKLEQSRNLIRS